MTSGADVEAVREHYDRLSALYLAFWGEHIHHGYWEDGSAEGSGSVSRGAAAAQTRLVERLAARARIPRGARVLDVGCGLGGSSLWLARELGCSVMGITISPVQARMAEERAARERLSERVSFRVMDAHRLDFEPRWFDAVWVIECSEHLSDKPRFIESCARVLRPGGVLALCAWLRKEEASAAGARLVASVCEGMLCPSLASMEEYLAWMRRAGLVEAEAEDLTRHVARTWRLCATISRRPAFKTILRMSGRRTRRFVGAFDQIGRAYAEGAMAYGMFTAMKAVGTPPGGERSGSRP